MPHVLKKIKSTFDKNISEGLALVTGQMPKFVYGVNKFKDIPVFCFHSAQYPLFEKQLEFLAINGYKTLTADELYERRIDKNYKNNGKEIAITFDDGMASVWTVVYPLLKKYDQKIISFILPGLMEEGQGVGATIDEVASEQDKIYLSNRDYSKEPLCNWNEVKVMHESGLVDFQSHGMNHALISISPKIVDFIRPDFDVYHYGNIHIPIYDNGQGDFVRQAVFGHPIYLSSPRLSALPRYLDDASVRTQCREYVTEHGGNTFFDQQDWRIKMHSYAKRLVDELDATDHESSSQVQLAINEEIVDSKKIIDSKLNKDVRHFCYPWFVGSSKSAVALQDAGYISAHVGATIGFRHTHEIKNLVFIKRVQEEYFMALPGKGSHTLARVFACKIRH